MAKKVESQPTQRRKKWPRNEKVIDLSKGRRKTYQINSEQNLTSASVISIAKAVEGMYSANLPKEKVYEESKEDTPPWEETQVADPGNQSANDDRILCQSLNKGLELWLKAYCPIPNNVCYLRDKVKKSFATFESQQCRAALGKPKWEEKANQSHWKEKPKRGQRPRYPVPGYPSLRCPTPEELINYTIKKGPVKYDTLTRKVFKSYVPLKKTSDSTETLTARCRGEVITKKTWPYLLKSHMYYGTVDEVCYRKALREMALRPAKPPQELHQTNIVRSRKVLHEYDRSKSMFDQHVLFRNSYFVSELKRYQWWLYNHEALNRHVDYLPAQYQDKETGLLYGSRYEGEKAGHLASPKRFSKGKRAHDKWDSFVCYYHSHSEGKLSDDQIKQISALIWGETDSIPYDVFRDELLFNIPEQVDKLSTRKEELLMLPPPSYFKQRDESNREEIEKGRRKIFYKRLVDSLHPSGHSQTEVYDFVLNNAWKSLSNKVIVVPESYSERSRNVIVDLPNNQTQVHQRETLRDLCTKYVG